MLSLYRAVMDSNVNPLRALRPAQRFQTMAVLGTMWTTIFCGAAGAWLWYGELVTLHLLVRAVGWGTRASPDRLGIHRACAEEPCGRHGRWSEKPRSRHAPPLPRPGAG